jgi:DNA-binding response OmpR family regulator
VRIAILEDDPDQLALLRRAYPREEDKLLSFPPFDIDTQRGEIRRAGAKVERTPKEFDLAVVLFRNIGRLMSRRHLQEAVWGRSGELATRRDRRKNNLISCDRS